MTHTAFDPDLITAAQSGDIAAMNALLTQCAPIVIRVASSIMPGEDAADMAQLALIRIWQNLGKYQQGNFAGWVSTITRNLCYDRLRVKRHRLTVAWDGMDYRPSGDPDPLYWVVQDERAAMVRTAIGEIGSEAYRTPVCLVDLDGMEYREAADALGIPVGTLKSRLFRGRQALAEALTLDAL